MFLKASPEPLLSLSTRSLMFLKLSDLALPQILAVVLGARGEQEEEEEEERASWCLGWRLTRLCDLDIGLAEDTGG